MVVTLDGEADRPGPPAIRVYVASGCALVVDDARWLADQESAASDRRDAPVTVPLPRTDIRIAAMTDAPVTVDDPTSPAAQRGVGGGVLEGDWPVPGRGHRGAGRRHRPLQDHRPGHRGVAGRRLRRRRRGAGDHRGHAGRGGAHPGARRLPPPRRLAPLPDPGRRAGSGRCRAVAAAAPARVVSSGGTIMSDESRCTRWSSSGRAPPA